MHVMLHSYQAIDALHTCVFPPVTSCMTDLDNDADEMEHEKNAPMPFIKPNARNSCTIICIANACMQYNYLHILQLYRFVHFMHTLYSVASNYIFILRT